MTRIKKLTTAICLAALVMVAAPAMAQAATKPANSCPAGFNLGALTADQILALDRTQAAIAAGVVSEAGVRAGVASVDKNGTGRVCVQVNRGLLMSSKPNGQYLVNIVDDNASVR